MRKPTIYKPDGNAAASTLAPAEGGLSPAQQECVSLLEQALQSAQRGEVMALALIAVGPFDFGVAIAGSDAPKLHLGCGVAMRTLQDRTSPPAGAGRSVLHR